VGAKHKLNEMYQLLLSKGHNDIVAEYLSKDDIQWHFIPPSAPHFGGLWESGVKLVKTHLKRVIGNHILTYEELYTLLTNIEALLNSRPLIAVYDDDQTMALTPAHFLIGQNLTCVPKPDISNEKISLLSHWKLLQNLSQQFWKLWSNDYLTTLQSRGKWQERSNNLKIDQIVVVKEKGLPPTKWAIGRVIELGPTHDKQVRVVKVKTSKGVYDKPAVKVIPLPLAEET
jgi:hypothetical protein